MMQRIPLLLLCLCCALAARADGPVAPREVPPVLAPAPAQEYARVRVVNAVDGAVQVSLDKGQTWQLVGRVSAPATESLPGYLASGYSQVGTVAASAVHGIRVRVGDTTHAYASLINILPREFSQTPVRFGGHVSGLSGIYTNIPTGTGIFRGLAPPSGSAVYTENGEGRLTALPLNYLPRDGDTLVIIAEQLLNPLREVVLENRAGGDVTATYADGTSSVFTHVLKAVTGVGRFDATSYTGVGAINTNHAGVVTVSTAPVTTSTLLEGTGTERRGGFQIEPAYHNSQTDEAGAPSILVVGDINKKHQPDLEGTPPLFHGDLGLAWDKADLAHSWVAQIRRGGPDAPWLPMPMLVGNQPVALLGVRAIRLVQAAPDTPALLAARLADAARAYEKQALAAARAGRTRVVRGALTLRPTATDSHAAFAQFYVDGAFQAMSNTRPFSFSWNTTAVPDGEYVVETRAEDANSDPLAASRVKVWVDNSQSLLGGAR